MRVPLIVGWVARRPELIWAGLGGWLTMLSDPGGPYPTRASAMGTFALMGAAATLAGGLAGLTPWAAIPALTDRKSTRLNSSHGYISYAVFCLKKKKKRLLRSVIHGHNV